MPLSIQEAKTIEDKKWYKKLIPKHIDRSLSPEKVDGIIFASMESALEVYASIKDDLARFGPNRLEAYRAIFERYHVRINHDYETHPTNLLAMYDVHHNELSIMHNSIANFHTNIAEKALHDYISLETLQRMVLAHELYHVIEMNEADIYTYQKIYKRKFLFFTREERLSAASEIGAYHFVKLAENLAFNPMFLEDIDIS